MPTAPGASDHSTLRLNIIIFTLRNLYHDALDSRCYHFSSQSRHRVVMHNLRYEGVGRRQAASLQINTIDTTSDDRASRRGK